MCWESNSIMARVALLVLLLICVITPAISDQHSLYYIYTALSKNVELPGIHEFTALGLLNDREIDYYNSKDQKKIPKQTWMQEKMPADYWDKGTQSRKSKEQWFKVNVEILMERMRHNNTDLHVLQWRHGCEIDESNGAQVFVKGIDEYSYDGSEFLSFDDKNMRWIAPVPAAEPTKRKWDDVPILNQYTKGYLEKECVDWLTKFMDYGKETMRKHSSPDVHVFAKKCTTDSKKITLTCLATGFYPKDVVVSLRKYRTSLPDHLVTSSGVRPNNDGTYQMRKSVDIHEDEKAAYDCYVTHSTMSEPKISEWDGKCYDCTTGNIMSFVGGAVSMAIVALIVLGIIFVLKKKNIICKGNNNSPPPQSENGKEVHIPMNKSQSNIAPKSPNGKANGHAPDPQQQPLVENKDSPANGTVANGDSNVNGNAHPPEHQPLVNG